MSPDPMLMTIIRERAVAPSDTWCQEETTAWRAVPWEGTALQAGIGEGIPIRGRCPGFSNTGFQPDSPSGGITSPCPRC